MGRKKKKFKPIIFCYYCDRTFENEKVLIQHQRAKHFKCVVCHKRLGSAHGMMVHVFQVHKQQIDKVPHAKEGRDSFHIDIFGMSNIPQQVIDEKHAERGEPPTKRQKLDNQQNPLIVDNVNVPQPPRNPAMNPMFANPMMNHMMNPMMMNPMMMGMFGGMNKPPIAPPMAPAPPNMPFNPYMHHPHAHPHSHPQLPPHPQMQHPNMANMPNMPNMPPPPNAAPFMPPHSAMYGVAVPQTNPYITQQMQPTMNVPPTNNNVVLATSNDKEITGTEPKQNEVAAETVANNVESQAAPKKKDKKHHLLYCDELISMEEQRFSHTGYHWTPNEEKVEANQDIDLKNAMNIDNSNNDTEFNKNVISI